jgi:hypothetical protein
LFSSKRMNVLLVAAVAAMALGAFSAGTASATVFRAKFSTSLFKLSTAGVTIKKNGAEAKSCTLSPAVEMWGEAGGAGFVGSNESQWKVRFNCTDGTYLRMSFNGEAKWDSVTEAYFLRVADYTSGSLQSPWGLYSQFTAGTDDWAWVNGSGATSSTITLNERLVGNVGGQQITISGTLTAKTSSGGLVTLSH